MSQSFQPWPLTALLLLLLFSFLLLLYSGFLSGDGPMAAPLYLGGHSSCGHIWGSCQSCTIHPLLCGLPPKANVMWPHRVFNTHTVLENLVVLFSHLGHLTIFLQIVWCAWLACCSCRTMLTALWGGCVYVDYFIQCCSLSQDAPEWNAIELSAAVTVQMRVSRTS